MSYSNRIKVLEQSYDLVDSQIKILEKSENPDKDRLSKLYETKNKYFKELSEMRRAEYESQQEVDFGDE